MASLMNTLLALALLPRLFWAKEQPAGDEGEQWAVIAAGSAGFWNYRHQADACHAYQIMKKSGIPEDHIILMMQDDVAHSTENPFPGKLFNKPGNNVPDVYAGCNVDYRGKIVTAKLFLSVITGDEDGVPDGGKVLKSGPKDRVFLNFVDHGGVGIIAFPNGPVLHVSDLSKGLKKMQEQEMFNELVFYMEACESGSMFPNLTDDGKIFAVTAANARESSWGFYCMPDDVVNGVHMKSCLGDLFSIAWMEDTDLGEATETIETQVKRVTTRTNKSHVKTFGDKTFESETIGRFESMESVDNMEVSHGFSAVSSRDIALHSSFHNWNNADADEKDHAWKKFHAVVVAREEDDKVFDRIARGACADQAESCYGKVKSGQSEITDPTCHRELVHLFHEECPRRAAHDAGGWNDYNMKFSQVLVNVCEMKSELGTTMEALGKIVTSACSGGEAAKAVDVVV